MTDEKRITIQTYESPWPVYRGPPLPPRSWIRRVYDRWVLRRALRKLFRVGVKLDPTGLPARIGGFTVPKEGG